MKTHGEIMQSITTERKSLIKARAEEIMAEIRLEEIRKDRQMTQHQVAQKLRVSQSAVSQMERKSGISLIGLKTYSEALGGTLNVEVTFPDGKKFKVL
ncbi:MAG: helix-turn-helix transcriptional regulator [Synergistota bacterium]|nr:helix-turn-helix transcriptional regulator [Synergistota bacterium]